MNSSSHFSYCFVYIFAIAIVSSSSKAQLQTCMQLMNPSTDGSSVYVKLFVGTVIHQYYNFVGPCRRIVHADSIRVGGICTNLDIHVYDNTHLKLCVKKHPDLKRPFKRCVWNENTLTPGGFVKTKNAYVGRKYWVQTYDKLDCKILRDTGALIVHANGTTATSPRSTRKPSNSADPSSTPKKPSRTPKHTKTSRPSNSISSSPTISFTPTATTSHTAKIRISAKSASGIPSCSLCSTPSLSQSSSFSESPIASATAKPQLKPSISKLPKPIAPTPPQQSPFSPSTSFAPPTSKISECVSVSFDPLRANFVLLTINRDSIILPNLYSISGVCGSFARLKSVRIAGVCTNLRFHTASQNHFDKCRALHSWGSLQYLKCVWNRFNMSLTRFARVPTRMEITSGAKEYLEVFVHKGCQGILLHGPVIIKAQSS